MTKASGTRVGFIGLGKMGQPMAANVARAGFSLAVWNRTTTRTEALKATGIGVASSPAVLAGAVDVLVSMVSDGAVLLDLYIGSGRIAESLRPGCICVDMSTVGPDESRQVAEAVHLAGGRFVDAPVSGSVALAAAGTLTIMAGGARDDIDAVRPVLDAMGSPVFHLGPVGAGATTKLAVNSIIFGLSEALSEALVLAERAGIERGKAYEVFAASAIAAPYVRYRQPAFLAPGEVPVAFPLILAGKDLDLALALAEQYDVSMPQGRLNRTLIADAVAAGFGEHDMSAIAEYLRVSHRGRTE